MSASTDQQNAQEQPPQPLLPTPVSKQPLPHDCITTNLDTLFEDEGKYPTPAQPPLLIKKAPSQALKSVTVDPERGSPLEIAKARAAARELLKIEATHSRQRLVNMLCGVTAFFNVALLLTTVGTSLFSRQAYRPHLGTTQVDAYNSSADGFKDDSGYDSDARTKDKQSMKTPSELRQRTTPQVAVERLER
ncbi:hypothetical protein MRX96_018015 [Rhipicephalus microplus]